VGSNPSAASYVGIDAGRVQFQAFAIAGGIAGLCGYLWVARFAVAYTEVAQGFELTVIAACVIGGVSIAGGVGTVTGLILGCLFFGVIRNALPLLGVSPFWQMAISGTVILSAAIFNSLVSDRDMRTRILEDRS
jgi:rhamnose transport system permease protein